MSTASPTPKNLVRAAVLTIVAAGIAACATKPPPPPAEPAPVVRKG